MESVLNEIIKLRNHGPITIDHTNSNRYRVLLKEEDGSKTAYYFSTPIYNAKTRKTVDMKFFKKNGVPYAVGSNCNITFSNKIRLENAEGYCSVKAHSPIEYISSQELRCKNDRLLPTTNGFVYKAFCETDRPFIFDLEIGKPFMSTRSNDKYFSVMSEKFRPFVTVSCIGTADMNGNVIAPAKIVFQKLNDRTYRLAVTPCSSIGKWVMFEINLYEDKLTQDTTVESSNPKTNNAFGGTAFIGNTEQYGEQWLYSRPNYQKLSDLNNKHIIKAFVHLPHHNKANVELDAFKVSARFCSFGSTWDNRISASDTVSASLNKESYQVVDITACLSDPQTGYLMRTEGFILKPHIKGNGFSVVATGDSCYTPQIFEINFK